MKRALVLAILMSAVAACNRPPSAPAPTPAPQASQPFDLHIEIGRYGAMLGQVANLTGELPSPAETDPAAPQSLARELRETVWEYNLTRSRLCARGLYPESSCGLAYEPTWIADPATAEPSLEELKARADAVGAEVTPFWNTVCDDIRARTADAQARAYVCAIE